MAKRLLPFLGVIVASVGTQAFAQSAGFPCDAFKVQTNGRLEVVRPVTITKRENDIESRYQLWPGRSVYGGQYF
jgi:hypothetical protein